MSHTNAHMLFLCRCATAAAQPLGPALSRAKLLESQGYHPVLVPFSEWAPLKTPLDKAKLLLAKVKAQVPAAAAKVRDSERRRGRGWPWEGGATRGEPQVPAAACTECIRTVPAHVLSAAAAAVGSCCSALPLVAERRCCMGCARRCPRWRASWRSPSTPTPEEPPKAHALEDRDRR